ncbi:MAG: hypothetical protein HYV06_06500 [Deltaproteobacteria bacterium]|nr:hypothetical protein [Deltaproteobacteria bacterium]
MNPFDAVREKLEACFIFNSYASPEIRKMAGVCMLSQVWIEVPAWYLWLHDVPGAFMLEALHADLLVHEGVSYDSARFTLRWFPPLDSGLLSLFSVEERCLRSSVLFDSTGTPLYEQLTLIRGGYFECAHLELHFSRGDDTVIMLLSTSRGSTLPDETLMEEYCTALFQTLAGMYSLYAKRVPESCGRFRGGAGNAALQALVFFGGGQEKAGGFMRAYLGAECLEPFRHRPAVEGNWRRLALLGPEAMDSSGCGCCCGH